MSTAGRPAEADNPGVVAPGPILLLGGLVLGVLVDGRRGGLGLPKKARRAAAATLTVAGAAVALAAGRGFKKAGTNILPNKPATALVTTGVHARSRNPGYIGQLLIYLGAATALNSRTGWLLVAPLFAILERGVVRREEVYLERRFGDAYRRYTDTVPRWL